MQQLFNIDSKLMSMLSKFADLFVLNLLTLVCSLPIITIGASFTAMHTVLLAMRRQECDNVFKTFFKSFLSNFRQSTVIWVLTLLYCSLIVFCIYMVGKKIITVPAILTFFLYLSAVLMIISLSWVFILQCRYKNPIWATLKNAFFVGIAHLGHTIAMVALFVCPFLVILAVPVAEPLILCLGFSCPGILQTKIYGKVIDRIDQMIPNGEELENCE